MSRNAESVSPLRRRRKPRPPITLERIEEMLLFCARLVDERGPIAQPLLDRMEAEYLAAKKKGREEQRIRALLQS